jgi:hypothetical protein
MTKILVFLILFALSFTTVIAGGEELIPFLDAYCKDDLPVTAKEAYLKCENELAIEVRILFKLYIKLNNYKTIIIVIKIFNYVYNKLE